MRSAQQTPKTVEDWQKEAAEEADFRKTEEYQRQEWEKMQDLWQKKAEKEGWAFKRQAFTGALERQQQAEEARKREIAELEERLAALKGGC